MTFEATMIWLLNTLIDTLGQLSFKAAATHAANLTGLDHWRAMFANGWLWLGLIAYIFEILLWIAFLSLVPLSMAVFLSSINILAVLIGGRLFFKEELTKRRLLAVCLIASGVGLVGWS